MKQPFIVVLWVLGWLVMGETDSSVRCALFVMSIATGLFGAWKGWLGNR